MFALSDPGTKAQQLGVGLKVLQGGGVYSTFHGVVEAETAVVHSMTTRFHAFSLSRLLELLEEVGFTDCRRMDGTVYQLIGSARRPPAG